MSLEPGRTLAHYRIVGRIGAGGMGEVYRAADTVLGRDVAIKTLRQDVSSDPARVTRFRREAHLLASLNHPHIAAIYGFEQADDLSFLVLEFVEGRDLADRLIREPLSVREALTIARQVAEALEAAHESGIVHRDLKPANITVRPDGTVKVLDFGLAKAWSGDGVGGAAPLQDSPTVTNDGTAAGVILGTAAYMAPEQARGRVVDRRADVWAFGAVLFEMLTGRPAFRGDTLTDILANVVHRDPEWHRLPPDTPASVRVLLGRCLAKDPAERLPHIGAARMELADVLSGGSSRDGEVQAVPRASGTRSRALGWLLGVSVITAAAVTAYLYSGARRDVPPLMRLAIELPTGMRLAPGQSPQISPDGRHVAVVGRQSGEADRIWVRPLDASAFRPLAGTEDAGGVFWAADSRALGFYAGGTRTLMRVSVAGGSPQTLHALGRTEFTVGASWNGAGQLLFSKASGAGAAIFLLSSPGQTPTAVAPRTASAELHWYPQWLSDHRRFLFVVEGDSQTPRGLYVSSIDDPSRRERILPETHPAVVRNGQLMFVRNGTLFAQPVDARLRLAGEPTPVAENAGPFSVSDAGTVVYVPARRPEMQLMWVARNGSMLAPLGDPRVYRQIALSSQGQVAVEIEETHGGGIWVLDARGVATRLVDSSTDPVWSPDGTELVFAAGSEGRRSVFRQALGSGQATQMLSEQGAAQYPKSWSAADGALLYLVLKGTTSEIWRAPASGHAAPEPLVRNGFLNDQPQLSPDGRWLAYISNESGTVEVYVAPSRRPAARVRVSPTGGGQPTWRGDSKELFYISANNHLQSVAIGPAAGAEAPSMESAPQVGTPTSLFEVAQANPELDTYAPAPDGQKFLVMRPVDASDTAHLNVLVNWNLRGGAAAN